jgi:hypothetical protein
MYSHLPAKESHFSDFLVRFRHVKTPVDGPIVDYCFGERNRTNSMTSGDVGSVWIVLLLLLVPLDRLLLLCIAMNRWNCLRCERVKNDEMDRVSKEQIN